MCFKCEVRSINVTPSEEEGVIVYRASMEESSQEKFVRVRFDISESVWQRAIENPPLLRHLLKAVGSCANE